MRHRIEDGYREKLDALLRRAGARRLDAEWLMARARRRSGRDGTPLDRSLAQAYARVRHAAAGRLALMEKAGPDRASGEGVARFLCDASLGGLARWLRAAGYAAEAAAGGVKAGDLLGRAREAETVLVTSDHRILERHGVREGSPAVVWVPSRLGVLEQLRMVLGDLGLPAREPLCMACGGELRPVAKAEIRDRIPPRTALWKDDYFLCSGCGKLFWHGTHWERIRRRLDEAATSG